MGLARGIDAEFTEVTAARVILLRQYEKVEHTRADAIAALAAGRWRLAGLSARASVGFALDVARAAAGRPTRDEIRRRKVLTDVLQSGAARQEAISLLTDPFTASDVARYLDRCWHFIDEVLMISALGIPSYYGDAEARQVHEEQRRIWLGLARTLQVPTPYAAAAVEHILHKIEPQ